MKQTAQIFKALSDETRLRIVGLLLEGELCVCDLVAVLNLPQSTVSRHLAYLKNSGLVNDRREGIWMHYQISSGDPSGRSLREALLNLLRMDLPGLTQVQSDQKALRKYKATKQAAGCG